MSSEPTTARPASSFCLVPRFGLGTWPHAALSSRATAAPSDINTTTRAVSNVRVILGFIRHLPGPRLGLVAQEGTGSRLPFHELSLAQRTVWPVSPRRRTRIDYIVGCRPP